MPTAPPMLWSWIGAMGHPGCAVPRRPAADGLDRIFVGFGNKAEAALERLAQEAENPTLRLVVLGPPVPKGRPRHSRNGHTYTPQATRDYERLIQAEAIKAAIPFGRMPVFDKGVPVIVTLRVYRVANRGDLDNFQKCLDACNRILWADDRQVVAMDAWMGVDKENPRLEVTVRRHV
jgi:Holliday junction resolvase RusA-like endonuclease